MLPRAALLWPKPQPLCVRPLLPPGLEAAHLLMEGNRSWLTSPSPIYALQSGPLASRWLHATPPARPTMGAPIATVLAETMATAGVDFDLTQREAAAAAVRSTALRRYLQQVDTAARQDSARQLCHFFVWVRPECLTGAANYCIAPHLLLLLLC